MTERFRRPRRGAADGFLLPLWEANAVDTLQTVDAALVPAAVCKDGPANGAGWASLLLPSPCLHGQRRFEVLRYKVLVQGSSTETGEVEAAVKVRVGKEVRLTVHAAEEPIRALYEALREALLPACPELVGVQLTDSSIRAAASTPASDTTKATSQVRVLVRMRDAKQR